MRHASGPRPRRGRTRKAVEGNGPPDVLLYAIRPELGANMVPVVRSMCSPRTSRMAGGTRRASQSDPCSRRPARSPSGSTTTRSGLRTRPTDSTTCRKANRRGAGWRCDRRQGRRRGGRDLRRSPDAHHDGGRWNRVHVRRPVPRCELAWFREHFHLPVLRLQVLRTWMPARRSGLSLAGAGALGRSVRHGPQQAARCGPPGPSAGMREKE